MLTTTSQYRRDIDGLRAIAVGSVVIFHAFPDSLLRGGFAGVDVFFVISGYLISKILLTEQQNLTFSFSKFYARRIRRIFPALSVVLVAVTVVGWFLMAPVEYKNLGKHLAAATLFSSNLLLWSEVGYFDVSAEQKPLLHLWSLGVEEQFYILWPAVLFLFFSFNNRNGQSRVSFGNVIILLSFSSFLLSIYWVATNPTAAFYAPMSRAWELLLGAAIAHFGNRPEQWQSLKPLRREAMAFSGGLLLTASFLLLMRSSPFPGALALLPTIGSALVIAAGPSATLNRVVLSHPLLVWLGLISYPLYLWHWPTLFFANVLARDGVEATPQLKCAAIVVATVLAWLTYRLCELPVRRRPTGTTVSLLMITMALLSTIGLSLFVTKGFPWRLPSKLLAVQNLEGTFDKRYHWQEEVRFGTCHKQEYGDKRSSVCIDLSRPLVWLWGDSHASSFYPGLHELQKSHNFGIAQFTTAGCSPFLSTALVSQDCVNNNTDTLKGIQDVQPEIILLHAAWMAGERYRDVSLIDFFANIEATVTAVRLVAPSSRIILLGPVPRWSSSLSIQMFRYYAVATSHSFPPIRMNYGLSRDVEALDKDMRQRATALNIEYISLRNALCDSRGCLTRVGPADTDVSAVDYGHLSPVAAKFVAKAIVSQLFIVDH